MGATAARTLWGERREREGRGTGGGRKLTFKNRVRHERNCEK